MHAFRGLTMGCLVALCGLPATAGEKQTGVWLKDFEQAEQLAHSTGRPLLVHFHADWCGPCRIMERQILGTPEVLGRLGRDVVAVKVNTDHRRDLVRRFSVEALPSDVYVTPQGKVLSRYIGSPGKEKWLARMTAVAEQFPQEKLQQGAGIEQIAGNGESRPPVDAPRPTAEDLAAAQLLAELDGQPGLGGFCPVSLLDGKRWVAGSDDLTATHRGVVYRFGTTAELERFQASPEKYAPQHLGCDVVVLERTGQTVVGSHKYAAFYRQRTYLFENETNREAFLAIPDRFTIGREMVGAADSETTRKNADSF